MENFAAIIQFIMELIDLIKKFFGKQNENNGGNDQVKS